MHKEFYKERSKEDRVKELLERLDVDAFALFDVDSAELE